MNKLIYISIFTLVLIACTSNKRHNVDSNLPVTDSIDMYKNTPASKSNLRKIDTLKHERLNDSINDESIVNTKKEQKITLSNVDSVSINEIKRYIEGELPTLFHYYKHEKIDEVAIWSEKLFGRCCSEADLDYSELLFFDITANNNNQRYPFRNLSDKMYSTAFVFKENENTLISIQLNRNDKWHKAQTNLLVDDVLKITDTILYPFRLSIVNGYVKSEKTFQENGSVKEIKIFLNKNYQGTVLLQDTPLVQEFKLDFTFTKNDVVTLTPISYYQGSKYSDICISEIQSSFSQITHPSINKKYKVRELWKIGYELRKKKK